MNTYRDKLRTTVNDSLTDIKSELSRRTNKKQISAQNVYFALNSEKTADVKLEDTKNAYTESYHIGIEGVACGNSANNIQITAQSAADDIATLEANAATTAQNVQIAANAISKLAASLGSANSIAFATMNGSTIHEKTEKAKNLLNNAAIEAETIAVSTMDISSQVAQITAPQVLIEATETKSKFDDMQQKTGASLTTLAEQRAVATTNLTVSHRLVRTDKSILSGASRTLEGTKKSYLATNDNINFNFSVMNSNVDPKTVTVNFKPFCVNNGDESQTDTKFTHDYYVFAVTADLAGAMTLSEAEVAFHKDKEDGKYIFQPVTQKEVSTLQKNIDGEDTELKRDIYREDIELQKDIYCESIELGKSYVLYLYIDLSINYKRSINNYSDQLSAPCEAFILTKALPKFKKVEFSSDDEIGKTLTIYPAEITNPFLLHVQIKITLPVENRKIKSNLVIFYSQYKAKEGVVIKDTYVIFSEESSTVPELDVLENLLIDKNQFDSTKIVVSIEELNNIGLVKDNKDPTKKELKVDTKYKVYFLVQFSTDGITSQLSQGSNCFTLSDQLDRTSFLVSSHPYPMPEQPATVYRCMFLPRVSVSNDKDDSNSNHWFTSDVAANIADSKYIEAEVKAEAEPEPEPEPIDSEPLSFTSPYLTPILTAKITKNKSSDIFGQPINTLDFDKKDNDKLTNYTLSVLAITPENSFYKSELSPLESSKSKSKSESELAATVATKATAAELTSIEKI